MKKTIFISIIFVIITLTTMISISAYRRTNYTDILLTDARYSHSIDISWHEIHAEKDHLFAVIFYNTFTTDYCLSVYKKNSAFFNTYRYITGGTYGNLQNDIICVEVDHLKIYFSLNSSLHSVISYTSNDNTTEILIPPSPFIFIVENDKTINWSHLN